MSDEAKKLKREWRRGDGRQKACLVGGFIALGLAVVGIFLPLIPQVPFAILAAYLFAHGSPRLHRWIRKNKYLGEPVRDWEDKRAVRPKLKIVSTLMMIGAMGIGHWKLPIGWAIALDCVFLASILFVITRRNP